MGRLLHDARAGQLHDEAHSDKGDFLKAMVFGGLDGILTSFAIVAGAAGQWQSLLNYCRYCMNVTGESAGASLFKRRAQEGTDPFGAGPAVYGCCTAYDAM